MFAMSRGAMSRHSCIPTPAASGSASRPVSPHSPARLTVGTFTIQVLLDAVHKHPELVAEFPKMVKGEPGAPVPVINWFDCSKSLKALDITPTSEESTAVDMTRSLAERKAAWKEAQAVQV